MFKEFFSNRLFICALVFFILILVGGTLYLKHVERQTQREIQHTEEALQRMSKPSQTGTPQTADVPEGAGTESGGHFHADGTFHDQPHAPIGAEDGGMAAVSDTPPGELEFWKKLGVAPPPHGYSYAELADGTMHLQKDNVPIVTVHIGTTPEFNSGWLPDDAYYYYDALTGLSSGTNLIGVGRLTPAETARAREMKDAFINEWAPHTNIGFSSSGVFDTDDHDKINEATDKAVAEQERKLRAQLGISENRNRDFDVDLMSEILTQIRKELSQ